MWLIATASSDSVRPRSGTEVSGRLKVGHPLARALCGGLLRRPCRTQARAQPFLRCVPAALLQLILQRGDGLMSAGFVQMAARRTGHANGTNGTNVSLPIFRGTPPPSTRKPGIFAMPAASGLD